MGNFDTVRINYSTSVAKAGSVFQTKNTPMMYGIPYLITHDGRLVQQLRGDMLTSDGREQILPLIGDVELLVTGSLYLVSLTQKPRADFRAGRLIEIREVDDFNDEDEYRPIVTGPVRARNGSRFYEVVFDEGGWPGSIKAIQE